MNEFVKRDRKVKFEDRPEVGKIRENAVLVCHLSLFIFTSLLQPPSIGQYPDQHVMLMLTEALRGYATLSWAEQCQVIGCSQVVVGCSQVFVGCDVNYPSSLAVLGVVGSKGGPGELMRAEVGNNIRRLRCTHTARQK